MTQPDTNGTHHTIFPSDHPLAGLEAEVNQLRETGRIFWQRGWSVGTSSNFSLVLRSQPLELLITASGKDKGRLDHGDFVRIGADGAPLVPEQPKSSAESLLHVAAAQALEVGCVLHTHSVWATELSELYAAEGGIRIEGYEMLKGLAGVKTHETSFWLEIFDNTQDIPRLAAEVVNRLTARQQPLLHGYLIRRHGLYTWGRDVAEARRHVEILEFLLECVARRRMLQAAHI